MDLATGTSPIGRASFSKRLAGRKAASKTKSAILFDFFLFSDGKNKTEEGNLPYRLKKTSFQTLFCTSGRSRLPSDCSQCISSYTHRHPFRQANSDVRKSTVWNQKKSMQYGAFQQKAVFSPSEIAFSPSNMADCKQRQLSRAKNALHTFIFSHAKRAPPNHQ